MRTDGYPAIVDFATRNSKSLCTMIGLESMIFSEQGGEKLMGKYRTFNEYTYISKHMRELKQEFDFIIFDCPPKLYNVTRNALFHSDHIIIPCASDDLSTMGLRLLLREMDKLVREPLKKKKFKKVPLILGAVV